MKKITRNLFEQFKALAAKDREDFWTLLEPHFDESKMAKRILARIDWLISEVTLLAASYAEYPTAEECARDLSHLMNQSPETIKEVLGVGDERQKPIVSSIGHQLITLGLCVKEALTKHLATHDLAEDRGKTLRTKNKQTSPLREPVNNLVVEMMNANATRMQIVKKLRENNWKTERKKYYDIKSLGKLIGRLKEKGRL